MKMCLCCLETTIAMQESESSFLALFDIGISFLFYCSFGGGMIFILFLKTVFFVCDSYRRGIIKSNWSKIRAGQPFINSTAWVSAPSLRADQEQKKLHAKDAGLFCFVLCTWIIPCNKSSCTPSLSLSDVNKTGICAYTYTHCLSRAGNVLIRGSL